MMELTGVKSKSELFFCPFSSMRSSRKTKIVWNLLSMSSLGWQEQTNRATSGEDFELDEFDPLKIETVFLLAGHRGFHKPVCAKTLLGKNR